MSKNLEDFKKRVETHFKRSKNSILEIAISHKGDVTKYSWNNSEEKRLFGLGSVSKTIISTYVCKLISEGKLDLDKTIDQYLNLSKRKNYPTVISLLTHMSGYHGFIPFNRSMMVMLFNGFNKKNIYENISNEWLMKSVDRKRPFKKEKYRYTDYNYALIALIIETIEQRPYKDIIIEFLRGEVGMKNTCYANLDTSTKDQYSWVWEDDNPFLASGGMMSTLDDMMLFLDYQIEHKEELELALKKYHKLNLDKNVFTGFSWNSFYNSSFFWHIGGQGYYRSYALFDHKKKISICILSTVDINVQHVNRLGSSLYRNVKRNKSLILDFLESVD